jgi:SpoVK/Ycf46/Vps4 family AAA+-type ATPase
MTYQQKRRTSEMAHDNSKNNPITPEVINPPLPPQSSKSNKQFYIFPNSNPDLVGFVLKDPYSIPQHNDLETLYDMFFGNKDSNWRVKDIPPSRPSCESSKKERTFSTRAEILAPLDEVFLADELMDDIVVRAAIPDVLEGTEPGYNGVILYGPPGTGKTVCLRAIKEVYERAGAYAKEISTSAINSSLVGQLAKNLEGEIKTALNEAQRRGKPAFLCFDEGSIIAEKASEGATSVAKHYAEALDVLKRYVGNYRELVLGIATNVLRESFEDALTREGRLTAYFVGYPREEERKRMWKHFADRYDIISLNDEQAEALAEATPAEQGAFIESFCRNYLRMRRKRLLQERGHKTLISALKTGTNINDEEVRRSITYEQFRDDLIGYLREKSNREGKKTEARTIGFVNGSRSG